MSKDVVLIVEDELIIRVNAVCLLEDANYSVIEAVNADEAIAYLEAHPAIRIVLSDIEMPSGSMSGLELAHVIRERWPGITPILTSGRVSPDAADMPSETVFLPKPYDESDLLQVLAKAA